MTPCSFSCSAIISSGANQMRASQAILSPSNSSHVTTPHSKMAQTPASATAVLDRPCQGAVTQPVTTASMMTTRIDSCRLIGPMLRSLSLAWARACSVSRRSGGLSWCSSQGMRAKVHRPGNEAASAQRAQVISTPAMVCAKLAIRGFAAMPVRNMADAA